MIYTSYFARYTGSNGVSVSIGTPKWVENIEKCYELMPPWELVNGYKNGSITRKEYRKAYIKQLKSLDVAKVYNKLNDKVLLCFERAGEFCHRQIIREWFIRNGYKCEELVGNNEVATCIRCKHASQYDSWACTKTGEILEGNHVMVYTCDDWRYFA